MSIFKTLPPDAREAFKDILEVASPITTRTKNDLDNKSLKILSDYVSTE